MRINKALNHYLWFNAMKCEICAASLTGSFIDWIMDTKGLSNAQIFRKGRIYEAFFTTYINDNRENLSRARAHLDNCNYLYIDKFLDFKCCFDCMLSDPYYCWWCGDISPHAFELDNGSIVRATENYYDSRYMEQQYGYGLNVIADIFTEMLDRGERAEHYAPIHF